MNQQKYRKILAIVINENIDTFDYTDLLCEFESTKEVENKMSKLGGDIDTNPKIKQFDKEASDLIKQTLRNIQLYVKENLPLWIIVPSKNMENNNEL